MFGIKLTEATTKVLSFADDDYCILKKCNFFRKNCISLMIKNSAFSTESDIQLNKKVT